MLFSRISLKSSALSVVRPLAPRTLLLPAPADVGPSVRVFTRTGFAAMAPLAPEHVPQQPQPQQRAPQQQRDSAAQSAQTADTTGAASAGERLPAHEAKRARHSAGPAQPRPPPPPPPLLLPTVPPALGSPVATLVTHAVAANTTAAMNNYHLSGLCESECGDDDDTNSEAARFHHKGKQQSNKTARTHTATATATVSMSTPALLPPPLASVHGSARFWAWFNPSPRTHTASRPRYAGLARANAARLEGVPTVPYIAPLRETDVLLRTALASAPLMSSHGNAGAAAASTATATASGANPGAGAASALAARTARHLARYAAATAAAGAAPLFSDAHLPAARPSAAVAGFARDLYSRRRAPAAPQSALSLGADRALLPRRARRLQRPRSLADAANAALRLAAARGDDSSAPAVAPPGVAADAAAAGAEAAAAAAEALAEAAEDSDNDSDGGGSGGGGSTGDSSDWASDGALRTSSNSDSDSGFASYSDRAADTSGAATDAESGPEAAAVRRRSPLDALYRELARSLGAGARLGLSQRALNRATRAALRRCGREPAMQTHTHVSSHRNTISTQTAQGATVGEREAAEDRAAAATALRLDTAGYGAAALLPEAEHALRMTTLLRSTQLQEQRAALRDGHTHDGCDDDDDDDDTYTNDDTRVSRGMNAGAAPRSLRAAQALAPLPLPLRSSPQYAQLIACLRLSVEMIFRFRTQARLRKTRREARAALRDHLRDGSVARIPAAAAATAPRRAGADAESAVEIGSESECEHDHESALRRHGVLITPDSAAATAHPFAPLAARAHQRTATATTTTTQPAESMQSQLAAPAPAPSSWSSTSSESASGSDSASSCDEARDIDDRLSDRRRRIRDMVRRGMGGSPNVRHVLIHI